MPAAKYPNLKLIGGVLDLHDDVKDRPTIDLVPESEAPPDAETVQVGGQTMAMVKASKPDFDAGDIAVYRSLDAGGRAAVRGRNTNYGYSGYFKASVFDGKGWRNLELRDFLAESDRNYPSQGESGFVRKRLVAAVAALAGRELVYGDRKYGMPGFKVPAPTAAAESAPARDTSTPEAASPAPTPLDPEAQRQRREAQDAEVKAVNEMLQRPLRE